MTLGAEPEIRHDTESDTKKSPLPESPSAEEEAESNGVVSWQEFTENTTFHGIKYVFEDAVCIRRLFWLFIIMGCLTFFVVQVGVRTRDYYRYDSVTSVTQKRTDKIEFPAVTLCNLNQFRISEASEQGLYAYLNERFSEIDVPDIPNPPTVTDTFNVSMDLGHKLGELIDDCYWRGRKCILGTDFRKRMLDIGLCYTFNYNPEMKRGTDQSGMEGGLRLLLNIETFEHMRGSNLDAGVKFLLHSPEDKPALRDLGFVATPGHHTLVSIKLSKMINLPDPWGDCIENGEPESVCKHRCITEDFRKHCNCSDTNMQPSDTYPLCDLHTKLTCGCDANNEDITTCGFDCSCPRPCEKNVYRPVLSSSMLSRINLDSFALTSPGKLERTNQTFQAASDIQLGVSPGYEEDILLPAKAVLDTSGRMAEVVSRYNPDTQGSLSNTLSDIITGLFRSDTELNPEGLLAEKRETMQDCPSRIPGGLTQAVTSLYDVITNYRSILAAAGDSLHCKPAFLTLIQNIECFGYNHVARGRPPFPPEMDRGRCLVDEIPRDCDVGYHIQCMCYLTGFVGAFAQNYLEQNTVGSLDIYKESLKSYTGIESLADERVAGREDHQRCITLSQALADPAMFIFPLAGIIAYPYDSGTWWDLNYEPYTLHPLWDIIMDPNNKLPLFYNQSSYTENCCWPHDYLNFDTSGVTSEKEAYESLMFQYQSLDLGFLMSDTNLLKEAGKSAGISAMNDVITDIGKYLRGEITTRQLAVNVIDPTVSRRVYSIVQEGQSLVSLLQGLQEGVRKLGETLPHFLSDLYHAMMTQLTTPTRFEATPLMQYLDVNSSSQLSIITERCKDERHEGLNSSKINHLMKMACSLSERFEEDIALLTADVKEFEQNAYSLHATLEDYYDKTEINSDFYISNFLQVDIYYEDLRYEEIEQQEAFGLISLFSEIGGFMGLLLGGSILTLCEVIDFMFVNAFIRYKKYKEGPAARQANIPLNMA